ncbi:MAG: DMSO/TMAO reductase YedYZ molybdopterin-dependent catalytic subunit [Porticoccaceae bacterium]|jgi:DMSO/TMAO reductase YedYZ molybdopterin-dependent catalytic subunit
MTTPPGQKNRTDFPRFGLPAYADRFPSRPDDRSVLIEVNESSRVEIDDALDDLPRTTICADFHCVTTWTYPYADWSGVTFSDFFKKYVQPHEAEQHPITGAVFYGQDGYRTTLLLEDLLRSDVMLADSLDGQPLTIEHGAPLRLVAPAHYGYKNLKHLKRIEFYSTIPKIKRGISAFLDHPRARVLKEERARWIPGWILRYVYRPLISGAVKDFRKAMAEYENK